MNDEKLEQGNDALLPCPFCGGKAEYSDPIMIGTAYYTVRCESCRITTARYNGKKYASKKWNRRTEQHSMQTYELFKIRMDLNLTQVQIAKKLGVSQSHYSNMENGTKTIQPWHTDKIKELKS